METLTCVVDATTLIDNIYEIKDWVRNGYIHLIVPLCTMERVEELSLQSKEKMAREQEARKQESQQKSFRRRTQKEYPPYDRNPQVAGEFLARAHDEDGKYDVRFQHPAQEYSSWEEVQKPAENGGTEERPTTFAQALRSKLNNGKGFELSSNMANGIKGHVKPKLVARASSGDKSPWKIAKKPPTVPTDDVPRAMKPLISYTLWLLYEDNSRDDASPLVLLSNDLGTRSVAEKIEFKTMRVEEIRQRLHENDGNRNVETNIMTEFGVQGHKNGNSAANILNLSEEGLVEDTSTSTTNGMTKDIICEGNTLYQNGVDGLSNELEKIGGEERDIISDRDDQTSTDKISANIEENAKGINELAEYTCATTFANLTMDNVDTVSETHPLSLHEVNVILTSMTAVDLSITSKGSENSNSLNSSPDLLPKPADILLAGLTIEGPGIENGALPIDENLSNVNNRKAIEVTAAPTGLGRISSNGSKKRSKGPKMTNGKPIDRVEFSKASYRGTRSPPKKQEALPHDLEIYPEQKITLLQKKPLSPKILQRPVVNQQPDHRPSPPSPQRPVVNQRPDHRSSPPSPQRSVVSHQSEHRSSRPLMQYPVVNLQLDHHSSPHSPLRSPFNQQPERCYLPSSPKCASPNRSSHDVKELENSDDEVVVFNPKAKRLSAQRKPPIENPKPLAPVSHPQPKVTAPPVIIDPDAFDRSIAINPRANSFRNNSPRHSPRHSPRNSIRGLPRTSEPDVDFVLKSGSPRGATRGSKTLWVG